MQFNGLSKIHVCILTCLLLVYYQDIVCLLLVYYSISFLRESYDIGRGCNAVGAVKQVLLVFLIFDYYFV